MITVINLPIIFLIHHFVYKKIKKISKNVLLCLTYNPKSEGSSVYYHFGKQKAENHHFKISEPRCVDL